MIKVDHDCCGGEDVKHQRERNQVHDGDKGAAERTNSLTLTTAVEASSNCNILHIDFLSHGFRFSCNFLSFFRNY